VAEAIGLSAAIRGPDHALLLSVGGGGIIALLVGLLFRWSPALTLGLGALMAQLAARLALGPDSLDAWTPLYAGGLLLAAELAWWSIEPRVPAWSEPWLGVRRLATVVLTCAAATVVSALVVLAAGAPLEGGVELELVGVVAAAAALTVVAVVARTRVR
jgi:hypothetical protein